MYNLYQNAKALLDNIAGFMNTNPTIILCILVLVVLLHYIQRVVQHLKDLNELNWIANFNRKPLYNRFYKQLFFLIFLIALTISITIYNC